MDKYYPDGDKTNANNLYGYVQSEAMLQVLKQCGDNLTRENVMKQAANLKNFHSDLMLPGIMVNTGPDDYFPIEQMQLMKFQRRGVGAVRRRHHRRGRALGHPWGRTRLMASGGVGPAATRIRTSKSLYGTSRRQANTRSPLRSDGARS
jgi:hypothetical protein